MVEETCPGREQAARQLAPSRAGPPSAVAGHRPKRCRPWPDRRHPPYSPDDHIGRLAASLGAGAVGPYANGPTAPRARFTRTAYSKAPEHRGLGWAMRFRVCVADDLDTLN